METRRHIVALSGGKDSTAMALRLKELNPSIEYEYFSTPVGNEPQEVFDHLDRLETILGSSITRLAVYKGDGLEKLIDEQQMIPNFRARFCTRILKIEPAIEFMKSASPCVQYVGLRADEPPAERGGIYGDIQGVRQEYPMRDWGWSLENVYFYLQDRGVDVPVRTDCEWCFYQRLAEWKTLWKHRRESFERAANIELRIGHTFRSPSRDAWPADLKSLGEEFGTGRHVRGYEDSGQLELFNCHLSQSCRVCSL